MKRPIYPLILALLALLFCDAQAGAQRRGGGGGAGLASRGGARASVNARPHPDARAAVNRPAGVDRGRTANVDRSRNVSRNVNVDRDLNVNREIDVNHRGGWYDRYDGCCHHPVATAGALTAATAATAAAIGSMVNTIPAGCVLEVVNGVTYERCGGAWYQPQFYGTEAGYVVVAPPR